MNTNLVNRTGLAADQIYRLIAGTTARTVKVDRITGGRNGVRLQCTVLLEECAGAVTEHEHPIVLDLDDFAPDACLRVA